MAVRIGSLPRAAAGIFRPKLRRTYAKPALLPDSWSDRALLLVVVLVIAGGPVVLSYYTMAIAIAVGIGVIGGIATNLIVGVAGQASIGNAAFMAIGAFTAAQVGGVLHWPFLAALILSGALAAAVGILVAIPAMRVRGLYLIVATLALHYVVVFVLTKFQAVSVGDSGFPLPGVALGSLSGVRIWYYIVLVSAGVSVVVMRNLMRTRFGRAWAWLARDEVGASVMGVPVRRQKVLAFAFTSFMIGVQGALFGYYAGVVSIDPFTFDYAVTFLAMIVIGGIGSVGGSVLGAIFVVSLPYALTALADRLPPALGAALTAQLFDVEAILYGLAIVVVLVWERRGIVYLLQRISHSLSTWPLSRPTKLTDV